MRGSLQRVSSKIAWLTSAGGTLAVTLALASSTWAGDGNGNGNSEKRNDEVFSQTKAIAVPGNPLVSFDISWVDSGTYYLADRSNKSIDIFNSTSDPTFDHQITPTGVNAFAGFNPALGGAANDFAGPNGVLTLKNNHGVTEIWVGDGPTTNPLCPSSTPTCSTIKVFTASGGNTPTQTIATSLGTTLFPGARRADELCHDPDHHLVLMANDADSPPYVTFVDTNQYKIVGKISVPEATNGIEQCQYDSRTGKFYLNIPEVNGPGNDSVDGNVYVISPTTMTVEKKFDIPVAKCAGPQGMAIGPDPQILLGCNAKSPDGVFRAATINKHSGKIMTAFDNEGGADEVWFNPNDGHYLIAGGSFLPNEQLGVVDSRFKAQDQTVFTGTANGTTRRAHSVAADSSTNLVFVPIPATGGGATLTPPTVGFQSSLCGQTAALQAAGCIAVFGTTNDDRSKVAHERGDDDHQE